MRRGIFLFTAAGLLIWSDLALAVAPTTDSSGSDQNDKASQRKEAMAVTKKPKPKGGATTGTPPVRVTHTVIQGNPEGPRPETRILLQYNHFPQVFVGGNVSGDFQQANFSVGPPFTVNSSGAMGGIFGGVLLAVPNTNVLLGPRIGWQGGNITGSITAPPASPLFTYRVMTNSMFYQEAVAKIPIFSGRPNDLYVNTAPAFPFVTASAGFAEVHTTTKGTSGAFSVTDGGYNPGITLTTGIGVPITRELVGFEKTFLGGTAEVFVQWRGTVTTATVNIPGAVSQGFWIQGVDIGVQIRY